MYEGLWSGLGASPIVWTLEGAMRWPGVPPSSLGTWDWTRWLAAHLVLTPLAGWRRRPGTRAVTVLRTLLYSRLASSLKSPGGSGRARGRMQARATREASEPCPPSGRPSRSAQAGLGLGPSCTWSCGLLDRPRDDAFAALVLTALSAILLLPPSPRRWPLLGTFPCRALSSTAGHRDHAGASPGSAAGNVFGAERHSDGDRVLL